MGGGRISSCGFFVGATASLDVPRTYVVLGVPRGGTSMCAGALRLAGIPMGDDITDNGNEDRDFISHRGDVERLERPEARSEYLARISEVISTRNRNHDVWGWKDPISAIYLGHIIQAVRNPHFVFVMRDPAAVAMREWVALPRPHLNSANPNFYFDHIDRTRLLYSRAAEIIRKSGAPALILSYERCLRYPEDFVRRILGFTGMADGSDAKGPELAARIADYVTPDAVSGRLSVTQRDDILQRSLRNDLSFYGSIDDAYRACAGLVNTGEYSDALTLSASILIAGVDGGRAAPQFVVSPQRFAVIEAGLYFIRAVAFTNTADQRRALMEVLKFKAAREFLAKHGIVEDLVENLSEPVARLQQTLEASMFGSPATGS